MGRKPVPIEVRHQIIGLLKDKTKSNYEIAKLVEVSEKCVRKTKINHEQQNVVGELPKSGKPPKLSFRDVSDAMDWQQVGTNANDLSWGPQGGVAKTLVANSKRTVNSKRNVHVIGRINAKASPSML